LCVDNGVGDGVSVVADSSDTDALDSAVEVAGTTAVAAVGLAGAAAAATGAVSRLASTRSATTEARHVDIADTTPRSRITIPDGEWCWIKSRRLTGGG
jgi:hypothetical protein